MPSFSTRAITGVAVALLAPTTLLAQDGNQDTFELGTIVVTASRAELPESAIGSAVTVVTREELETQQVRRVSEILHTIPGVAVAGSQPGQWTQVGIRGSDNDQVFVLIDGIRLGDPSSTSTSFQFDHLTSLDIDRIEVLRGNQSSLYGSDAIGGVINIITRRAPQDGFLLNTEVEGGSYGTFRAGTSAFWGADGMDARLSAFSHRADGPSNADPVTAQFPVTEDDRYRAHGLSGRIALDLGRGFALDVSGFTSQTELDYDSTPEDSDDSVDKDEYALGARLTHALPNGRLSHELSASTYNARRAYFTGYSKPGGDIYDGTLDRFGYTLTGRPNDALTIIGGLSHEREKTHQSTNFSGDFDAKNHTDSVFAELAFRPVDNFTLTAAFRSDDNDRFGVFDTHRLTAAYFLPLNGGMDLKLRSSYGTGAKAPGLYQLFDPAYGNTGLGVEESKGWDVGFDLTWHPANLRLETSYFRNDVTNEIAWGLRDDATYGYYNAGASEAEGIEVGLSGQPFDWLQVSQSYTWLLSRDADDGSWKGAPRHTGSTSLTFLPAEDWSVTARARYASTNARSGGGEIGSFVVVDLLGSYRVNEQLELYGRVENLFDTHYQTSYGNSTNDLSFFAGLRFALSRS